MCGLTGILAPKNQATEGLRHFVNAMNGSLVHRGPDTGDVWVGEGIALGLRRLSILDLSPAGAQPMHSACRRYVIAYNGEIYNHLDLRRDGLLDPAPVRQAWAEHLSGRRDWTYRLWIILMLMAWKGNHN